MSPSSSDGDDNDHLLCVSTRAFKTVIDEQIAKNIHPNQTAQKELSKVIHVFHRCCRACRRFYKQGFAFWALENLGRKRIVYCLQAAYPKSRDLDEPAHSFVSKIANLMGQSILADIWDIHLFFGPHIAGDGFGLKFLDQALSAVAKQPSLPPHRLACVCINEVYLEAVKEHRGRYFTCPYFYHGVAILDDHLESAFDNDDMLLAILSLKAKYNNADHTVIDRNELFDYISDNDDDRAPNSAGKESGVKSSPCLSGDLPVSPELGTHISPYPILQKSSNFATTCNRLLFAGDERSQIGGLVDGLESLKVVTYSSAVVIDKILSNHETKDAGSVSCLTMKSVLETQPPYWMSAPPRHHLDRLKKKRFLVLPVPTKTDWAGYLFDSHTGILRWYDDPFLREKEYQHGIVQFLDWLYQDCPCIHGKASYGHADAKDDASNGEFELWKRKKHAKVVFLTAPAPNQKDNRDYLLSWASRFLRRAKEEYSKTGIGIEFHAKLVPPVKNCILLAAQYLTTASLTPPELEPFTLKSYDITANNTEMTSFHIRQLAALFRQFHNAATVVSQTPVSFTSKLVLQVTQQRLVVKACVDSCRYTLVLLHKFLELLVRKNHCLNMHRLKKRKLQRFQDKENSSIRNSCLEGHRKRWRLVQDWSRLAPLPSTGLDKILPKSIHEPPPTSSPSISVANMSGIGDASSHQYTYPSQTPPSFKSLGDLYAMLDASIKCVYDVGNPMADAFKEEEHQKARDEKTENEYSETWTTLLITLLQLRAAARNFRRAIEAKRALEETLRHVV
ncbi:hypothetical protein NPX13_g1245 [Xylaria arbuscula]|uniref:Uncharacterized protein n=1 Tax=Xylaria arbuscula TaxID=114810 RepID=A0A9W8NMF3_9PEZI|nr:hypothetical protein NPX13_g1245 [Xylaria arbuscula]